MSSTNQPHESYHSTKPIITDVRTGQEMRDGKVMKTSCQCGGDSAKCTCPPNSCGCAGCVNHCGPEPGKGARVVDEGPKSVGETMVGKGKGKEGCRRHGKGECGCDPGFCQMESMGKMGKMD